MKKVGDDIEGSGREEPGKEKKQKYLKIQKLRNYIRLEK